MRICYRVYSLHDRQAFAFKIDIFMVLKVAIHDASGFIYTITRNQARFIALRMSVSS